MKFSIIVPIYGVENYLSDCLNSIRSQTFTNFEVIMVDDGTKDNSNRIIDDYANEDSRFRAFHKKNGGQSSARNYGVNKAMGDYIIFVDGDDLIEPKLLERCFDVINKNTMLDIVRFQTTKVSVSNGEKRTLRNQPFGLTTGLTAFSNFIETDELFDSPCLYAFRRKFYLDHQFMFAEGKIHEDFGLIPYIIIKAAQVISIEYPGYIYMERTNSVMTKQSEEHLLKRMNDMFFHYDYLHKQIVEDEKLDSEFKKIFYSFLSNAILGVGSFIPKKYQKKYKEELQKRHVADNLRTDTVMRKCKKYFAKYFLSLYLFVFIRKGR